MSTFEVSLNGWKLGRNSIVRTPNSFISALGHSSKISFQNKHSSPETVVVLYQCLFSHKRKVKKRHSHVYEVALSQRMIEAYFIMWKDVLQKLFRFANDRRCFWIAQHLKLNISFVKIGFWQVNWRWKPYLVISASVVNSEKKVLDSNVSQLWAASLNPGRLINGKKLNLCHSISFINITIIQFIPTADFISS